ncbi:MAG: SpoIID/LytB domain-containing protein [Nitriliruptor sp.]
MLRTRLSLTSALGVVALLGAAVPATVVTTASPAAAQADDPADPAEPDDAAQDPEGFPVRSAVAATGDPSPTVRIHGSGWGHGVGMSQYGAYAMSRAGHSVQDILEHYYPGTELSTGDTSASIRVGLRQGVNSTWVTAVGGDLSWDGCPLPTESGPAPHEDCIQDAFAQPQGTTWYVCPERRVLVGDDGTETEQVVSRLISFPNGDPTDRNTACDRDDAVRHGTPTRPVLRIRHHGTDILTPGPQGNAYHRGFHDIVRSGEPPRLTTVQTLPDVEQYLYGLAEMPASWGNNEGAAALQSQAITGRTYALRTRSNRDICRCDILATPLNQAYAGSAPERAVGGRWREAVDATDGVTLTYEGTLAETYYSSSHGGRTENSEDSWAYSATIPYLRSVADPWSLQSPNPYRWWRAAGSNAATAALVSETAAGSVAVVERLAVQQRTEGGSPEVVTVTGRTSAGERVSFDYVGQGSNGAGARIRTNLPTQVTARADGGTASLTRVPSSQISRFSFGPFDDEDGSVHEYAIVWAQTAGVVNGTSASTYEPAKALRRDQMATLIFEIFDIPEATDPTPFEDVGTDNVHHEAIAALAEVGIAKGVDGDNYAPSQPVTRAQMASLLALAAGWDRSDTAPDFDDVRAGSTHAGAIAALVEEGVTTGCTADRFCPGESVSRAQAATFMYRLVRD